MYSLVTIRNGAEWFDSLTALVQKGFLDSFFSMQHHVYCQNWSPGHATYCITCWWFGTCLIFRLILGISSSQLTFIFFRGGETINQIIVTNCLSDSQCINSASLLCLLTWQVERLKGSVQKAEREALEWKAAAEQRAQEAGKGRHHPSWFKNLQ